MTTITRCQHDMQIIDGVSTCADCLGLPDVPIIDALYVGEGERKNRYIAAVDLDRRGYVRDDCVSCSRCRGPIPTPAAWSATDAGPVCADCADDTD